MLVALGVAWYARGAYDQATQDLIAASDLTPDNPIPYIFLGKMQSVEGSPSQESLERLARFVRMQPDNPLANYYYAVGLWKKSTIAPDINVAHSSQVESPLLKAVRLDPNFGAAYLQLGILYSQRAEFARAIGAYQKAIEVTPDANDTLEQAHYRLAQAYLRIGEKDKAQAELKLHSELAKKTKDEAERNRREIKEFEVSLQSRIAPE